MLTSSEVPLPAGLEIVIRPPRASTRSIRPMSPDPFRAAPPIPSSRIDRWKVGASSCDAYLHDRGSRVFGRVGQGFGNDVVGGHLDRVRQPSVDIKVESTGTAERRARVLSAGPSPPWTGSRDEFHVRSLADPLRRRLIRTRVRKLLLERRQFGRHARLCGAQLKTQCDQPLLGAVVQIAFETAARVVGGRDDAGA